MVREEMARPSGRLASLWRFRHGVADAGALAVGTVVNGLAAYVFVALGTRRLGAEGFAPISVLWTFFAITAATTVFPVQHWILRTLAAEGEARVRAGLPFILGGNLVLALVLGGSTWWFREALFGSDARWWYPSAIAVLTLSAAVTGVLRGGLAGRGRFLATATAIGAENSLRVLAGLVAVAFGWGAAGFTGAMLAGVLVAACWPSAFRFAAVPVADNAIAGPGAVTPAESRVDRRDSLGFVTGFAGASLIAQVVLTSGPVVLALLGGAPGEITGLFTALALFRAPYLLGLGVAARVTGTLTALVVAGRTRALRRLRWASVGLTLLAALAAGLIASLVGPWLLRVVFGGDVRLSHGVVGLVAAVNMLAVGSLLQSLFFIARSDAARVLRIWLAALATALVWLLFSPSSALATVVGALAAAELVAFTALAVTPDRR